MRLSNRHIVPNVGTLISTISLEKRKGADLTLLYLPEENICLNSYDSGRVSLKNLHTDWP